MGKIIISTILSLLFPGLGQLYNKQRIKGIIFIVIGIVLVYVNIYGFLLPLTLFRFIAALEAAVMGIRKRRNGDENPFLTMKHASIEIGVSAILIFSMTMIPYELFIKPGKNVKLPTKSGQEMQKIEEKAVVYMNKKYKKEFVATESLYSMELGKYKIYVHPKTNKEMQVSVTYVESNNQFSDDYMNAVWGYEFDQKLEAKTNSLFKHIWEYSSGVWVDEKVLEQIDPLNIPAYKEVRQHYPKDYEQKLQIYVFEDANETKQLEKVNQIVQEIRKEKINSIQFEVAFYKEELLKKKGPNIRVGVDYLPYLQYSIVMDGKDLSSIEAADDIRKFVEKAK